MADFPLEQFLPMIIISPVPFLFFDYLSHLFGEEKSQKKPMDFTKPKIEIFVL